MGFYFTFRDFIVLLWCFMSLSWYDIWIFYRLVTVFYLYMDDLDRQNIFNKTEITNQIMVFSIVFRKI